MKLEGITQVKLASHKMMNPVWFHFYKVPRIIKFIETKSRIVVARVGGMGNGELVFNA